MGHIEQEIKIFAGKVDEALAAFAEKTLQDSVSPEEREILEHSFALMQAGGKRLRPWLVKVSAELFGYEEDDTLMQLSLVPELLHLYLLIHDDVMDHSATRRGVPTVHEKFRHELGVRDSEDVAENLALLAGDYVAALVGDQLDTVDLAPEQRTEAAALVSGALKKTIRGQALDLKLSVRKEATEAEIMEMYEYKTSYYSVWLPLRLGALLAGITRDEQSWLDEFSRAAGIAFQIQDDILGVFGDEDTIGKSTTSDIREGKMTLIRAYGDASASPAEKRELAATLGSPTASDEKIGRVKELWQATGAKRKAEETSIEAFERAEKILAKEATGEEDTLAQTLALLRQRSN